MNKSRILAMLLAPAVLFATVDEAWLASVVVPDSSVAESVQTWSVPANLSSGDFRWLLESHSGASGEKVCSSCLALGAEADREYPVLALVSFSMPDAAWQSLSSQLQEAGGAFVLRGLPDNSFSELVSRIQALSKKGVTAPIVIDPRLFREFKVDRVPALLVRAGETYDTIRGNVSVKWALGLASAEGERL